MSNFLGLSLGNEIALLSPSKREGDYHHERKQGDERAMLFHNLLLIQTDSYFYAAWLASKGYAMEKKSGSVNSGKEALLCGAKS